MAEKGAQRPSGDPLHQRVGRIVGAQATVDEVGRATSLNGVYPPVIQRPSKPNGGPNQSKFSPTTTPPVSA